MTTDNLERKTTIGTGIPVPGNDIDTDRIIPARFMKCVTFDGLEEYAFYDVRYDADGNKIDHPFNDPKYAGGSILIANINFGCGSSREHAPQSLVRFGMAGIVAESFAEIFAGNCCSLGVPAVTASQDEVARLMAAVEANPKAEITIDLETKTVTCGDLTISVDIPESSRQALVAGTWDTTAQLLANVDAIKAAADKIPYLDGFAA
ncbi:3-isopropylmalate dehydratase small subunit [Planctomycetota bacterium]